MMSRGFEYAVQSLAATGFAVMHPVVAAPARPDLWHTGVEAAGDLGDRRATTRLHALPGVRRFRATLAGITGPVELLARSDDRLAERILWITGRKCTDLVAADDAAGSPAVAAVPPPARVRAETGDRVTGRFTAEGPRTCSGCQRFTAAATCIAARESGIANPHPNEPRRCLAFTPLYESTDNRTGKQLWPELTS